MNKIYISYANEDYELACKIRQLLTERHFTCSLVNHTNSENGAEYDCAQYMLDGINQAERIVMIYTGYSEYSLWQSIEIVGSYNRNKTIDVLLSLSTLISDKFKMNLAHATVWNMDKINDYLTNLEANR